MSPAVEPGIIISIGLPHKSAFRIKVIENHIRSFYPVLLCVAYFQPLKNLSKFIYIYHLHLKEEIAVINSPNT